MIKLSNKYNTYLKKGFQLIATLFLFVVVIKKIEINNLLNTIQEINLISLVLVLLLSLLLVIFPAARTLISFNTITATKISWLESYQFFLIGMFYNNILPSSIGGDVARTYLLYKKDKQIYKVSSVIILERLIGLVTTIAISLTTAVFIFRVEGIDFFHYYLLIITLIIVILFLIFNPSFVKLIASNKNKLLKPIFNSLENFLLAIQEFKNNRTLIVKIFIFSLLYQLADIYIAFLLSRVIHMEIPFLYFLVFIPLVYIITLLPITINGLGLRENVMVYLFTLIGAITHDAFLLSLLIYLDRVVKGLVGGICLILYTLKEKR